MSDCEDLAVWAKSLPESLDVGLDSNNPLDAKILDLVGRAGEEVSSLARDHGRLKEENEALARRVKLLESKLLAIVDMARAVSVHIERAVRTGDHGESREVGSSDAS